MATSLSRPVAMAMLVTWVVGCAVSAASNTMMTASLDEPAAFADWRSSHPGRISAARTRRDTVAAASSPEVYQSAEDGDSADDDAPETKRYSAFRSDLGKRKAFRSDLGRKRSYDDDDDDVSNDVNDLAAKRYSAFRSDLGKRSSFGAGADRNRKRYSSFRSDLGKRVAAGSNSDDELAVEAKRYSAFRSDLGKRSSADRATGSDEDAKNDEQFGSDDISEWKRYSAFRSDLGKRRQHQLALSEVDKKAAARFRSDLGKRAVGFRTDLGKRSSSSSAD